MSEIITGAYTCKDGGVYTYDAFWEQCGARLDWRGFAQSDKTKTSTHTWGEMLVKPDVEPETLIRRAMEEWIEVGCICKPSGASSLG